MHGRSANLDLMSLFIDNILTPEIFIKIFAGANGVRLEHNLIPLEVNVLFRKKDIYVPYYIIIKRGDHFFLYFRQNLSHVVVCLAPYT